MNYELSLFVTDLNSSERDALRDRYLTLARDIEKMLLDAKADFLLEIRDVRASTMILHTVHSGEDHSSVASDKLGSL